MFLLLLRSTALTMHFIRGEIVAKVEMSNSVVAYASMMNSNGIDNWSLVSVIYVGKSCTFVLTHTRTHSMIDLCASEFRPFLVICRILAHFWQWFLMNENNDLVIHSFPSGSRGCTKTRCNGITNEWVRMSINQQWTIESRHACANRHVCMWR